MSEGRNDFLLELLGLQQDGQHSISGPDRWKDQVPLAVQTPVSEFLVEHAEDFISVDAEDIGRWHFLVGSPGNGKSAAVGDLYRKLTGELECKIEKTKQENSDSLPYRVEVRRSNEKFSRLWLIQDASTVEDPMSANADAAVQLADTLHEAEEKGVSLVVCANRGILERVYDKYMPGKDQAWFKQVVVQLIKSEEDSIKEFQFEFPKSREHQRYSKVKVTADSLDCQNLIRGENSPVERLLENAVSSDNWTPCTKCKNSNSCPFFGNAKSLREGGWIDPLLKVLRRVEAWSGQTIVFREAVSLVGYFLAGCPHDYKDDGHPCKWVAKHVEKKNYFSLMTRRLYAALFGSPDQGGLDSNPKVRDQQLVELRTAVASLDSSDETTEVVKAFLESPMPSVDTGAERLLGIDGVLRWLDPVCLPNHDALRSRWSLSNAIDELAKESGANGLEETAIKIWADLESKLEESTDLDSRAAQLVTNRWASSFLLRLGGFVDSRGQIWADSLDKFDSLLVAVQCHPKKDKTIDLLEEAGHLVSKTLNKCLKTSAGVQVSHCIVAEGPVADRLSKATVLPSLNQSGLAIGITFVEDDESPVAFLNGQLWAWLHRVNLGLIPACLPSELFQGLEIARTRAVTDGSYSRARDTTLSVVDETNGIWKLYRKYDRIRLAEPEEK